MSHEFRAAKNESGRRPARWPPVRSDSILLAMLGVVLSGCATAPVAPTRAGTAAIEIRVTESEAPNKPAAFATVTLHSPRLSQAIVLTTGADGHASVGEVPSGIYTVQIEDADVGQVGVGDGERVRVALRRKPVIFSCGYWVEVPRYGIERSLMDDDAATDFLHQPRTVHLLP